MVPVFGWVLTHISGPWASTLADSKGGKQKSFSLALDHPVDLQSSEYEAPKGLGKRENSVPALVVKILNAKGNQVWASD